MYDSGVASENQPPLEELKILDQRLLQTRTLEELQPLFTRAEQIAQQHSANFEVQLEAHEVKQRILARGSKMRQAASAAPPPPTQEMKTPAGLPTAARIPTPPPSAAPPPPSKPLAAAPVPMRGPTPAAQMPPRDTQAKSTPKPTGPSAGAAKANAGSSNNEPPKKASTGVVAAWLLAGLVGLAAIGILVSVMRDRGQRAAENTVVDASITTTPPGAAILVNGQQTCTSDCVAKLLPGTYEVTASLDGYDPAKSELTVAVQTPTSLALKLEPQPPRVRVLADFREGQVFLDNKPIGNLQDGTFTVDRLESGSHALRVVGGNTEASFQFLAEPGALPAVQSSIATKDLLAAVVSNAGNKGRMTTNSGALKVAINGTDPAPVGTEAIDLPGFRGGGANEFVLTDGTKSFSLFDTFPAGAGLTVFLRNDPSNGILLISTAPESDVRVFVNDKEARQRTQKGEARIATVGKVEVRVEKSGFEPVPPQTAVVEKGKETRLTFAMKALPQFSSLAIIGGTPGAEVVLDQKAIGNIAADGTFHSDSIPPGDRTIDLRREQYEPKRLSRSFKAGQTLTIAAGDATLTAVRVVPPEPTSKQAPEVAVAKLAAKSLSGDMSNFDNPAAWSLQQDKVWHHKGAGTLTYGLRPNGVLTFSVYMFRAGGFLRGGRVRWFVNYTNAQNYGLFELDEENFWAKTVVNGKTSDRKKVAHKQDKNLRVWNIQIDVSPTRVVHRIQGDKDWIDLDTWTDASRDFTQGKFGFLVSGNDEIGLSNFRLMGR